ncbi:unnamed protein product [Parascedosporium putredinis]|uniref:Spo11/DNA topoisomerase VI subunit A N-terminal domain-containing protein n=1 Tax=Parascedosporium putredinis TaxID=1442378 RepID=A0A9P1M926_9PEZI|nr:unnamed protein product [Parascedosporium putredinis]CAI7994913.1 unnamed protein product [Parascedosporium putredinis]
MNRNLYYEDPEMFGSQDRVDELVDGLALALGDHSAAGQGLLVTLAVALVGKLQDEEIRRELQIMLVTNVKAEIQIMNEDGDVAKEFQILTSFILKSTPHDQGLSDAWLRISFP